MKVYVINGANINMLGIREPSIYGSTSYGELVSLIKNEADARGIDVEIYQSNHEGALVDKIQEAYFKGADGIIINPGAYTHTSIAILDAVKATTLPTVEVHISDVDKRESYRLISYVREACIDTVSGRGVKGYVDALDIIKEHVAG